MRERSPSPSLGLSLGVISKFSSINLNKVKSHEKTIGKIVSKDILHMNKTESKYFL